jgi:hypothetical protein
MVSIDRIVLTFCATIPYGVPLAVVKGHRQRLLDLRKRLADLLVSQLIYVLPTLPDPRGRFAQNERLDQRERQVELVGGEDETVHFCKRNSDTAEEKDYE